MPTSLPDFRVTSRVLVVEGKQPLTRREAATRLGCTPETLKKRLRKYRIPGQQVRVHFYELHLKIRPLAVSLQECYLPPMPSPLRRLAQSLAGAPPSELLQSPPEGQKPFLATPVPPIPVTAPPAPPSAVPAHARLLTHAGRTQSIRAWASTLGIDRRTLAYRLNHGWSVDQALGVAPRLRDRTVEQAASAEAHARVLVVDDNGHVMPRREAAQHLSIKVASLTHRLRQYRPADGSTARVPLSLLEKKV